MSAHRLNDGTADICEICDAAFSDHWRSLLFFAVNPIRVLVCAECLDEVAPSWWAQKTGRPVFTVHHRYFMP